MDFQFLLNPTILAFLTALVMFAIWEIIKAATKKEVEAKIITTVNGAVAVVFAVLIVALKLEADFWQAVANAGMMFAVGSFYDLLKSYGAVKVYDK
jgi:hypothetical protein